MKDKFLHNFLSDFVSESDPSKHDLVDENGIPLKSVLQKASSWYIASYYDHRTCTDEALNKYIKDNCWESY